MRQLTIRSRLAEPVAHPTTIGFSAACANTLNVVTNRMASVAKTIDDKGD